MSWTRIWCLFLLWVMKILMRLRHKERNRRKMNWYVEDTFSILFRIVSMISTHQWSHWRRFGMLWSKGVNTVPEAILVWRAVRYISDTGQYRCTVSDLPLFFTILYNIQSYISNNSIYNIGNILYFFMELLTFTTTPYMISCCEGWKKLWVYVGLHFHHLQVTTLHMKNYDKNCLKFCNINVVLNINLLQYSGNMEIHRHYVTSFVLKGQNWKEVMGELIFYSKIKSFQCF